MSKAREPDHPGLGEMPSAIGGADVFDVLTTDALRAHTGRWIVGLLGQQLAKRREGAARRGRRGGLAYSMRETTCQREGRPSESGRPLGEEAQVRGPSFKGSRLASRNKMGAQNASRPRENCESSVALSHTGSGTSVPQSNPAPAPGRQWLRHLCPTKSTTSDPEGVITCAQPSQGGPRHAGGAFDG
jgi:hypothetical protein